LILHPKRASSIFYYVFAIILFIIGLAFMVLTSYGAIIRDTDAWTLSSLAMIFGIVLLVWAETKHYFTLYIITTWNVRVRTGIFRRRTIRVFYDEITECRTTSRPDERRVGMGDVEVFSSKNEERPTIIFDEVHNPDGVREIIMRFIQSIPDPLPWRHLDRT
jgi:membrane protein YdbS with pleckstrin-like domain